MTAGESSAATARKPRRHKWLRRLLALLFGALAAWILLELLVLVVFGEVAKFPRRVVEAPWGLRYNDPGASYRHKSADGAWRFRINSQGMRASRDYAYDKPAGVKRIVSVGDSFAVGFEVHEEETFAAVLERELKAAGLDVEVLNAGVSGFSNAEECLYLERELIKYHPDLVVVSFYGNDLSDNVRSGLFSLEGDELTPQVERYVPVGGLANFLNTNWLFNILSERSNAFVLLKEQATLFIKRKMVERSQESRVQAREGGAREEAEYQKRLCGAILNRVHEFCRERSIALVIQSISMQEQDLDAPPVEMFPIGYLDVDRPGLKFLSMKNVLASHEGKELLYWKRSQGHWTPFSHEQSGKALAKLILETRLLQ